MMCALMLVFNTLAGLTVAIALWVIALQLPGNVPKENVDAEVQVIEVVKRLNDSYFVGKFIGSGPPEP